MSILDLSGELQELRDLKAGLLATAKTDAERARITGQVVALSKQIQALAKDCDNYKVQSGQTLDRDAILALAKRLVVIISEELAPLPVWDDWKKQLINYTNSVEAANWIDEVVGGCPDKYMLVDNIAARIGEAVSDLNNDAATIHKN